MSRAGSIAMWIVSGPALLGLFTLVATQSPGAPVMVLIAVVLGPVIGLGSGEAYFTWQFKAGLAFALFCAALCVFGGIRFFDKRWGKPLIFLGSVIWTVAGGLGLGPQ